MGRTVNFFFFSPSAWYFWYPSSCPAYQNTHIYCWEVLHLPYNVKPSLNLLSKNTLWEAEEMVCSHPVSQICVSMQAFSGKPAPMLAVKAAVEGERKRSLHSGWLSWAFGMAAGGRCESIISGASTSVTSDLCTDIQPLGTYGFCGVGWTWEWFFGREHGLGSQAIHCPWQGWVWGAGLVQLCCSPSASPSGGTGLFSISAAHRQVWETV